MWEPHSLTRKNSFSSRNPHVEIERVNLNVQVTLLVQKGARTPLPPRYIPGYGLVWAVINLPELPINDEARSEAHIASTDVPLY